MSNRLATHFAPTERLEKTALNHQVDYFSSRHITRHLLDAVPSILAILNEQRQIVYANRALIELAGVQREEQLHGRRLGEALSCIHSGKTDGGCGTSENCQTCGATLASLGGLAGTDCEGECHLTRCPEGRTEALDLQVNATPLTFRESRFTVVAINDISHEKRRKTLERIFFHDVLNILCSIKGFSELLHRYNPENRQEIYQLIHAAADQVVDEIEAQRLLQAAETHELKINPAPIDAKEFLQRLIEIYRHHDVAEERRLELDPETADVQLSSDRTLLARILGNMLKNALEASKPGEKVIVGCRRQGNRVEFWVQNPAIILPATQLQIFQRCFSTKGHNRGLGTYSMKLLSEYLQGKVSFSSGEGQGTVFRATYPVTLHPDTAAVAGRSVSSAGLSGQQD